MKAVIAVLAVVLAIPAGALADPNPRRRTPAVPTSPRRTSRTRSPCRRTCPPSVPSRRARPAGARRRRAPAPAPVAHADSGLDWSDAGMGALTAVLVGSASFGAAVFVRRRHPAATGA